MAGDGEAETGSLATAWHSNKFLNPVNDGAALPILHLNGYKISSPTVLARITHEELEQLLHGYGWIPLFVEGHEPAPMHQAMAAALDAALEQIKQIQRDAREHGETTRPRWPMNWTVSGQSTGGTDVPLSAHGEVEARQLAPRLRGMAEVIFYRQWG